MLTKSKLHILTCFILRKQYSTHVLAYVPKHDPAVDTDIVKLTNFINKYKNILILTGAGVSTESGIPDYRSEGVGLYARTNHKPIHYQTYLKSPFARQRYWARNFIGWPKFSSCLPNDVHFAIQELEEYQKVSAVVTQNVDNLHFKAKSKNVIELHGSAHRITCLGCRNTFSRYIFQEMLAKLNPDMTETATMVRPDGDVEIPEGKINSFRVPQCSECGGIYKPNVVFFGDNVPIDRVNLVKDRVRESDALLVLGSTVTVFSSYRIVLQAKELNLPIAIVNIGQTRADDLVTLKISTRCGDILPHVSRTICR